jgi:hypothetical protein
MSEETRHHHGEIWSTRVQQELLVLTTDNADLHSTENRSILPPFTNIVQHHLDITAGECTVLVQIDVSQNPNAPPAEVSSSTTKETDEPTATSHTEQDNKKWILVELDISLQKSSDGKTNADVPAYPFLPPVVRLACSPELLPPGSTIQQGQRIGMDLDWTPSLHLTDVILNVGLKMKESSLQKEPIHPEPEPQHDLFDAGVEAIDDMARGAKRFAANLTKKAANLGRKTLTTPNTHRSSPRDKATSPTTPSNVQMGDEIDLLQEPWDSAHGVYSCKAIRRPRFIQDILDAHKQRTAAAAEPITSPTAMFRSLAQSARSVMEESFLMVTNVHIIELKASRLNAQICTVTFCIPIEMMAKLKFRRGESLSLFFKPAPDDPLIYMCADSGDAVHQIQSVLKSKGVRGKHTNAAAYRAINEALKMVQEIQTKEIALEHDPSLHRVNEIMDLYRQAAERFEVAGDIRHEEVVTHMRKFLAKPKVIEILDKGGDATEGQKDSSKTLGSSSTTSNSGKPPVGEVLEPAHQNLDEEDDTDNLGSPRLSTEKTPDGAALATTNIHSDQEFTDSIDNLLKDAEKDFGNIHMEDDPEELLDHDTKDTSAEDIDKMAADLDAMMKDVDKELADLMNS